MKKVSCIIPAYNEGPRIAGVLRALAGHPLVGEIIVIDDASTDNTAEVASSFANVRVESVAKNAGKSAAIITGIKMAKEDSVLFLDADLSGLTKDDITALIEPVLNGSGLVSISLRNYWFWSLIGLDPFSGERVFPRSFVLDNLDAISRLPPFGLETFLNDQIIKQRYRIQIVKWENVGSPYKHEKYGFWSGAFRDIRMAGDILRVSSPIKLLQQIFLMLKLREAKTK